MLLKMTAMGVVFGRGSYFMDRWNWVDFIVVVASGATLIPMLTTLLPSMSILRVARAVRPIRSVTAIPKLRAVVEAIIISVPGLTNVAAVLAGLFLVFGILGLNTYAGKTDFRCRATLFPVAVASADMLQYNLESFEYASSGTIGPLLRNVIDNRTAHPRCGSESGGAPLAVNILSWTKELSPWYTPRNCVWPIVPELTRGCNAYGIEPHSGKSFAFWQAVYRCPNTTMGRTYCGSNFDDVGNARFVDRTHMKSSIWNEDTNWGFTSFDNILLGFITTFQCITLEGWSDVMWRRIDTTGWYTSAAAFVLLEMIGSYFLMNLVLAVLGDTFDTILEQEELAGVTRKREQVADQLRVSGNGGSVAEEAHGEPGWWELTDPKVYVGMVIVHPKRGRGVVAKISSDGDERIHVRFVDFEDETHRYKETSWDKMTFDPQPHQSSGAVGPEGEAAAEGVREAEGEEEAVGSSDKSRRKSTATAAQSAANRALHHAEGGEEEKGASKKEGGGGWMTGDGKGRQEHKVKKGFLSNTDLSVIFNEFDVDHDGTLDRDEVIIALDVFLAGSIDLDYLTHVYDNQMDVDGDGSIDFSEFVAWFRKHLAPIIDEECSKLMVVEKSVPCARQIDCVARWWNRPTNRPWCKCKCFCGPCLYAIVTNWVFEQFIILLILINTVTLALESYPVNPTRLYVLDIMNFILNYLFLFEMILKLSALGLRIYIKDFFNVFDGLIVMVSMLESVLAPPGFVVDFLQALGLVSGSGSTGLDGFSVFRTLRIFRVFRMMKLAQKWKALQNLLLTTVKAIGSSFFFMILLATFIFIYALVGTQLFANKLTFDSLTEEHVAMADMPAAGYRPRSNFDNLYNSFVVVFQVLSGENWNEVFYDCWRSSGSPWIPFAYFASLICVGSFVLLDFFLAILLNDFAAAVKTHSRSVNKEVAGTEKKSPARKVLDAWWQRISDRCVACLRKRCGYVSKADRDFAHQSAIMVQNTYRRRMMKKRGQKLVQIATNSRLAATKINAASRGYLKKVEYETLRRSAVFSGVLRPRFLRLKKIALNGSFRQLVPARIRHFANTLLHRSLADFCCCVRHFEGKLVRTDIVYAGAAVGTTKARICRIHDEGPGLNTFTLEITSWGQDLARQLAASGRGASHREPMSYADVRLMLPPSVSQVEFDRIMELADVDGDGKIDPDELTIALDNIGGTTLYNIPHSRVHEFTIMQQLFVEMLSVCTFDNLVIACIFFSAIILAVDDPLINPASAAFLDPIDLVINVIFTCEMMLKIAAVGFLIHEGSYLRDAWNVLDFVIVLLSWTTRVLDLLSSSLPNLAALKVIRILRVFRMLRTINKLPGLKLVVTGILSSIVPLVSTVPVIFFVFLTFAIAFTQMFMGGFSQCSGAAYDALSEAQQELIFTPVSYTALSADQKNWVAGVSYDEITSKAVCTWLGAEWGLILDQSFDDVTNAASALIQMSTTEAWVDIARVAVDSRGIDMQPQTDYQPVRFLMFMLFEAVGAFFLVNLFVGVLIINVAKAKHSAGRTSLLMTDQQLEWYDKRAAFEKRLKPLQQIRALRPTVVPVQIWLYDFLHARHGPLRAFFCTQLRALREALCIITVAHHSLSPLFPPFAELTFDQFILATILVNSIMTGATYFGEPSTWTITLAVVQTVALAIFTVEMLLKMMAYGILGYLTQKWNIFDGTIVMLSLLGNVSDLVLGAGFGAISNVVRMLRLVRLVRLVKQARGLRVIYETLYSAIPALVNIAFLLAILFFIYAVLGVQLFAKVGFREAGGLDEHRHFMDFETAMLNLFVCATGEAWPEMMYAISAGPGKDECVDDPPYNDMMCGFSWPQFTEGCIPMNGCGVGWVANIYFFSFQVLCTFVMFNLIVFYVLDSFASGSKQEDSLNPAEEELLLNTWLKFDTKCSGFLETERVAEFFYSLPQPLGFHMVVDETKKRKSCKDIALLLTDRALQTENQCCWWCPKSCQGALRKSNSQLGKYSLLLAEEMAGAPEKDDDEVSQIPLSDVLEMVIAMHLPEVPIENISKPVHALADIAIVASQRKAKYVEMKEIIDDTHPCDNVMHIRDALFQYTQLFCCFTCCYTCRVKDMAAPEELELLATGGHVVAGRLVMSKDKQKALEKEASIRESVAKRGAGDIELQKAKNGAKADAAGQAEQLMRSFQRARPGNAAAAPARMNPPAAPTAVAALSSPSFTPRERVNAPAVPPAAEKASPSTDDAAQAHDMLRSWFGGGGASEAPQK